MYTDLFEIAPFSFCSEKGKQLLKDNEIKEKAFAQGETMLSEERALCVLLSGKATVTALEGGKSVQLNKLSKGNVFGVASLFSDASFPTLVTASCVCRTVFVPEELICKLIENDPSFAAGYVWFLTEKIRFLNDRIRAFTAPDAQGKLAVFILQNAGGDGVIPVRSMAELAKKLDLGRASLYRALDSLCAAGTITRSNGCICINDIEKLKSIAKKEI